MKTVSDNLSNNEVVSGNFSQNTLINFNADFNGLEKTIGIFFPAVRNAMVERYRAETTLKIGFKAQEIIEQLKLETQPIPPKAAFPLFDKLSLEHEEDMYEIWAKLLVAASDEYNPIYNYYSEILSKIGIKEARILLDIYNKQKNIEYGGAIASFYSEDNIHDIYECMLDSDRFIANKINDHLEKIFSENNLNYKKLELENKEDIEENIKQEEFDNERISEIKQKAFALDPRNIQELKIYNTIIGTIDYLAGLDLVAFLNIGGIPSLFALTPKGYKFVETLEKYDIKDK